MRAYKLEQHFSHLTEAGIFHVSTTTSWKGEDARAFFESGGETAPAPAAAAEPATPQADIRVAEVLTPPTFEVD